MNVLVAESATGVEMEAHFSGHSPGEKYNTPTDVEM